MNQPGCLELLQIRVGLSEVNLWDLSVFWKSFCMLSYECAFCVHVFNLLAMRSSFIKPLSRSVA